MISLIKGIVFLASILATGAIGYYLGSSTFSPVTTGIATLAEIVYDEKAEAVYEAKIEVLDAQLAEKEIALSELEQKNEGFGA